MEVTASPMALETSLGDSDGEQRYTCLFQASLSLLQEKSKGSLSSPLVNAPHSCFHPGWQRGLLLELKLWVMEMITA
jgi:hypothetical protein